MVIRSMSRRRICTFLDHGIATCQTQSLISCLASHCMSVGRRSMVQIRVVPAGWKPPPTAYNKRIQTQQGPRPSQPPAPSHISLQLLDTTMMQLRSSLFDRHCSHFTPLPPILNRLLVPLLHLYYDHTATSGHTTFPTASKQHPSTHKQLAKDDQHFSPKEQHLCTLRSGGDPLLFHSRRWDTRICRVCRPLPFLCICFRSRHSRMEQDQGLQHRHRRQCPMQDPSKSSSATRKERLASARVPTRPRIWLDIRGL